MDVHALDGVVSVQSVVNVAVCCLVVQMCEGPISVVFCARRENNDFVKFGHFFEKLACKRSKQNRVFLLVVVN